MKELDFDELDRAVNSLMTNTTSVTPSGSDEPQEKILSVASTDTVADTSPLSDSQPSVEGQTSKQSTPHMVPVSSNPPPTIRRSSGRFMDVVHSSSEMKQSSHAALPSRQGITVSPAPPLASKPVDVVKPLQLDRPVDKSDAPSNDWPDPLDMLQSKQYSSDTEPPTQPAEPVHEEVPPLSSPFLADTKVEKRPLGGTGNSAAPDDLDRSGISIPDTAETQTTANADDFETPLPEEFSQELVAIESGEAQPQSVTVPEPSTPKAPTAVAATQPPKVLIPDHFPDKDIPRGPVSITQQYREQSSSGDQSNGPIYDTDTYHKPLAHPAKKKSGWLWVVWIVLILVIGAGIGAAFYYWNIVK